MNTSRRYPRTVLAGMLGLAIAGSTACERRVAAGAPPLTAATPYGVVPGTAYDVWTPAHMQGATIPVTLPDGRQAHLVIAPTPPPATYAAQPVVLRESVVAPRVQTVERVAPRVTSASPRRTVVQNRGRSWQKKALIVGGSAGAGALIGGLAGGKKGAAIGAAAGGVGGLVYDAKTGR